MELNYENPENVQEDQINIKSSDMNLESTYPNQNNNIDKNNKKLVKFDTNNFMTIPLTETYNLRYSSNRNTFNDLEDNVKDILFDPKYSEKRSKSAYSKKSFREKFESMKLKVPEIKKWNCDPTAEVIIHNLELKIDILTYENFLLTKKIRELVRNNKELQLNLSQNILMLKTEKIMNDEKVHPFKNNKKKDNKFKDKDVDFYKEINKLKDENFKLKNNNQNLLENNTELNKIIEELKNEIKLNNIKFEDELNNNKIFFEKKLSDQIEKNNELNNIINNNNYNNIMNNNDNNDNIDNEEHNNNNSNYDLNKYLMNEELQYKKLLEENEQLHKQLRILLSIEDDDINKYSYSFPDNNNKNFIYSPIKENNLQFNSINKNNNLNNINNKNVQEDLINENYILKQKIKALNNELNKVTFENNQKLLKIQQKLNENELKNKIEKEKEFNKNNNNNYNENNNKDEELDKILNDTLLNINPEDEESKKMISTIENMKNNDKKRISQCLIINNKMKSLSEENNLLHSQLLSLQKNNKLNNINNINNLNESNGYNTFNNPHFCFCKNGNNESYDYLINALKIKDEIIIKYKEKNDDNENKYKALIIENSKLKELKENNNKKNNNYNFPEKDIKINSMRRERAEGLEDYLLGKIVNNQKEVLGERAPRFYENNYKYMSNSMQVPDNNNKMKNRYNNYHYKGNRMTGY